MEMLAEKKENIEQVLNDLFHDAKNDYVKMIMGMAKSLILPIQPSDFKEAYLSISKEQGKDLVQLIRKNNFKNIVEFGTSFGISTLFLAKGAIHSRGTIITTELIASKAQKAIENFKRAGVGDIIEVRNGDAMETLKNHDTEIDFLLLDGWKNLYLPLFKMLEPNFHSETLIYVDNADMPETSLFLKIIAKNRMYRIQSKNHGKVAVISKN